METLELFERALRRYGDAVRRIGDDQWHEPTPCTDWDVRALVNHLAVELLWVPPLVDGRTIAEVGDRFDGDQLGDDPTGRWDEAAAAGLAAFSAPGALDRTVDLSYGPSPADHYCRQLADDLVVHGWDLARAIAADERIDRDLLDEVYADVEKGAQGLAASGLFDPPLDVESDADLQTRMLALVGRRA